MIKKNKRFAGKIFFGGALIFFGVLLVVPILVEADLLSSQVNTNLDSSLAPSPAVTLTSQQTLTGAGIDSTQQAQLYTPASQVPVNNTSLDSTQAISLNNTTSTYTGNACNAPRDIGTLFDYAKCLLSGSVIPFIIGLGLVLFLAGVVKYVAAGDNEEQREASRNMMIYGIIAIFVMISVWGFVKILTNTFGFDFALPTLPPSKNNPALSH